MILLSAKWQNKMARNKKRTRPIIINAPKYYNPGKGRPREELAYISNAEKKRLLGSTDFKSEKTKYGILSFADDSASSMGVSRGDPSQDTKGGGSSNRSGSSSSGSSGSGGSAAAGGASKGTESGGVGAQSGSAASPGNASQGKGTESGGVGAQSGGTAANKSSSGSLLGGTKTSTGTSGRDDRAPSTGTSMNPNNPVGKPSGTYGGYDPLSSISAAPKKASALNSPEDQRKEAMYAAALAEGAFKAPTPNAMGMLSSPWGTALNYGGYATPASPADTMTAREWESLQDEMLANPKNKLNSSALGGVQIVGKNLYGPDDELTTTAKKAGITDNTVMGYQAQENMMGVLGNEQKVPADAWESLKNKNNSTLRGIVNDAFERGVFDTPTVTGPARSTVDPTKSTSAGLLGNTGAVAPSQGPAYAGDTPFATGTDTYGLEPEQAPAYDPLSSMVGRKPNTAAPVKAYDPLSSMVGRKPNTTPGYDPLSSMIGRKPNTAPAMPAYNPLGSIQAPRKAPAPNYDPLSGIQAPRRQPAFNPLSGIQAPRRAPAPGYDPLSSPQVPEQTPGWSPPGYVNPAKSFAEPQLQAKMRTAVNAMTEAPVPSIADMRVPGESPYRSLMDPRSPDPNAEVPDDMTGEVIAEEPLPGDIPVSAYAKKIGVTPQQLSQLAQSLQTAPKMQDRLETASKMQDRLDPGAPLEIASNPEYTPEVAPPPATPPLIARKNIPAELRQPQPSQEPININPADPVQMAEVRQRTSVNPGTDITNQAQQAILERYGDMGVDLVQTINKVNAAMRGGGRSNMAKLVKGSAPSRKPPPPTYYDEEIPLLEA